MDTPNDERRLARYALAGLLTEAIAEARRLGLDVSAHVRGFDAEEIEALAAARKKTAVRTRDVVVGAPILQLMHLDGASYLALSARLPPEPTPEQAEIARLRAEIASLRGEPDGHQHPHAEAIVAGVVATW